MKELVKTNMTTTTEEYEYSQAFTYGIIVCLGLAAAVGFVGNVLLVVIITKARKLRSVMNRFILHLAIGDLIVCAICIPLFLAINFYGDRTYPVICKMARFLQYLAPQATIMLLITIGMNRHQAIVHPLQGMTYKTANKLIFGAWLYSLIVVAPSIYLTNVQYYTVNGTNITKSYCATIPVTTKVGMIYVLSLAFFGYMIPLFALLVLYSKISYSIWRRNSSTNHLRTSRPVQAMLKTRKKVIKMFLTVILVFVITWLPLIIYVGVLESYFGGPKRISYTRLTLYAIGLSNSVYNPFIYSFFNKRFREGCKSLFRSSVRVVTKTKTGRRSAVREKKCSFIGHQDQSANTNNISSDPDQNHKESMTKFSSRSGRDCTDENAIKSKENVKLLTVRKVTTSGGEKLIESQSKIDCRTEERLHHSTQDQPPTDKDLEFHVIDLQTPSGSVVNLNGHKRRTAFKTLSVDSSLFRPGRKYEKDKLRKTVSMRGETVEWSNDFENIF